MPNYSFTSIPITQPEILSFLIKAHNLLFTNFSSLMTEDSIETTPHITLLYHLLEDDFERIKPLFNQLSNSLTFSISNLNWFHNDESSVLHLSIQSDSCQTLHSLLSQLPNVSPHKEYQPHITLCYFNPLSKQETNKIQTTLDELLEESNILNKDFSFNTIHFQNRQDKIYAFNF